jgi:Ulp1 family protease
MGEKDILRKVAVVDDEFVFGVVNKYPITARTLRRITAQTGLMNDEALNAIASWCNSKVAATSGNTNVHFVHSYFMPMVQKRLSDPLDFVKMLKPLKIHILDQKSLVLIANVPNQHWFLLVLSIDRDIDTSMLIGTVKILNPMRGCYEKEAEEMFHHLTTWLDDFRLQHKLGPVFKWNFMIIEVVQQKNDFDCGVFCSIFMHFIARNIRIPYSWTISSVSLRLLVASTLGFLARHSSSMPLSDIEVPAF